MDEELVHSKIDLIEENMKLIKEFRKTRFKEFKQDRKSIQAAKHCLQEAIESCIDISYHLISSKGYRKPKDYKDTFKVLAEENVFEKSFSEKLQDMAGFRNLLVHRYGEIDVKRLHQLLKEDSKDIKKFIQEILEFMERDKK